MKEGRKEGVSHYEAALTGLVQLLTLELEGSAQDKGCRSSGECTDAISGDSIVSSMQILLNEETHIIDVQPCQMG